MEAAKAIENMKAQLTEEFIDVHCKDKNYAVQKTPKDQFLRIDVSNLVDSINLTLYPTGSLVVGGKASKLKEEFDGLNQKIKENPEVLGGGDLKAPVACGAKYNVLLNETRLKIKEALGHIDHALQLHEKPTPSEEYRAKLTNGGMSAYVTQYTNGTLFLQGKDDTLFALVCDTIEENGTPTEEEIIARFFSSDDESLAKFTAAYTPDLLVHAEKALRERIGDDIFNFLESHDQKWFVASECLRIANIALPEFSPIVMPASKGFEGFIKKLLTAVGFYSPNHFDSKTATFAPINDRTNPTRAAFVAREKYAETHLIKISTSLDTNRNFMMHSDGSKITKLETYDEAVTKLEQIYDDVTEIFDYFKKSGVFGL
jgi:hypothetical protein